MAYKLLLAASLLLLAAAPTTSAGVTAVGDYYVSDGVDYHTSRFCIWGDVVICFPGPGIPQVDRVAPGEAGIWQESNGCPGRQTTGGYCGSTGQTVGPDTRIA